MKRLFILFLIFIFIFTAGCSISNPFDNSIKIGVNIEQTGSYQASGNSYLKGIQLAIKKVNDNGGINDQKIKLIIEDNESKAKHAAENMKDLIKNKKVIAVLGSNVTPTNIAAAEEADRLKVPLITGTTVSLVTQNKGQTRKYVYSTVFSDKVICEALANFGRKNLKKRNAFILYKKEDLYGRELAENFKTIFSKMGGKVYVMDYVADRDLSYLPDKLKSGGNDLVFMPGEYTDASKVVLTIRKQFIKIPVIGPESWDMNNFKELVGKNSLENLYFGSIGYLGKNSHRLQTFIKEYKDIYKAEPEIISAQGYDNALFLLESIIGTYGKEADALNKAIGENSYSGITGDIKISSNHQNKGQVSILTFRGGRKILHSVMYPLAN